MKNDKKNKKDIITHIIRAATAIVACFVLAVPILIGILIYNNAAPRNHGVVSIFKDLDGISSNEDGSFLIEIRRGESSQSVGRRLERTGIIKNRYLWNLICRINKEHLKTGTYQIEPASSQLSIHSLLVSGRQVLHRITIPEGVTIRNIAKILEEANICTAQSFLEAARDPQMMGRYNIPSDSMEGYLFPDTYLFPAEYPAPQVVRAMADNFFAKLQQIYPDVTGMPPEDINKRIIIASIVEREYRVAEEAPVMAGVFYNRIRINMALQSCATVVYIITEIQGKPHPSKLFNRDLEINSHYNTYMYAGLPPGPISAPGAVALKAAFFPEETAYLYFRLVDANSGRHYFSSTFDDHIKAGELIVKGYM
jgi:UPF0755 protein